MTMFFVKIFKPKSGEKRKHFACGNEKVEKTFEDHVNDKIDIRDENCPAKDVQECIDEKGDSSAVEEHRDGEKLTEVARATTIDDARQAYFKEEMISNVQTKRKEQNSRTVRLGVNNLVSARIHEYEERRKNSGMSINRRIRLYDMEEKPKKEYELRRKSPVISEEGESTSSGISDISNDTSTTKRTKCSNTNDRNGFLIDDDYSDQQSLVMTQHTRGGGDFNLTRSRILQFEYLAQKSGGYHHQPQFNRTFPMQKSATTPTTLKKKDLSVEKLSTNVKRNEKSGMMSNTKTNISSSSQCTISSLSSISDSRITPQCDHDRQQQSTYPDLLKDAAKIDCKRRPLTSPNLSTNKNVTFAQDFRTIKKDLNKLQNIIGDEDDITEKLETEYAALLEKYEKAILDIDRMKVRIKDLDKQNKMKDEEIETLTKQKTTNKVVAIKTNCDGDRRRKPITNGKQRTDDEHKDYHKNCLPPALEVKRQQMMDGNKSRFKLTYKQKHKE